MVRPVSLVSAAEQSLRVTVRDLFYPFRLERWIALGFVAFLDQCGRTASPSYKGGWSGGGDRGGRASIEPVLAWLGNNVVLAATIAAVAIAFGLALTAVITWLNSRGTFMYLDNVATGRADVARPWREHASRAGSYFVWQLGLSVMALIVVLSLLVPIGWAGLKLMRSQGGALPLVVLVVSILVAVTVLSLLGLFSLALRDFVAPLQWFQEISCSAAIRVFAALVRARPLLFLGYVVLKLVFALLLAMIAVAVCCVTCCLALIPVVHQTVLQPLFYFERRWSIELLAQLGYAPPGSVTAVPPMPPSPPVASDAEQETPPPPPNGPPAGARGTFPI